MNCIANSVGELKNELYAHIANFVEIGANNVICLDDKL